MKTANKLRVDLANNQRTENARAKWLAMAENVNSHDCWGEKTEHGNNKIGDVIKFTDATFRGSCVNLSMKEGKAFAFGEHSMIVVYRGKLKKIKLSKGDL